MDYEAEDAWARVKFVLAPQAREILGGFGLDAPEDPVEAIQAARRTVLASAGPLEIWERIWERQTREFDD